MVLRLQPGCVIFFGPPSLARPAPDNARGDDDAFGGAAEPDVFQPRVTVRGQDNQVRTQRLGRVANFFKRLALPDDGRNVHPC